MPWVSREAWARMEADRDVLAALVREQMATIRDLTIRDLTVRAEQTVDAARDRVAVRLSREEAEGVAFPEAVAQACTFYAQGDAAEEAASLEMARDLLSRGMREGEVIRRIALGRASEMAVAS